MSRPGRTVLCLVLALCAGWLGSAGADPAAAQGVFREDFEGIEPSWRVLAADTRYRVDEHLRVRDPVHSGAWSESLVLSAMDGTYVHFGRQIGTARIIDELRVSLWVRSDHPGLQLLARVVMPRTVDPDTHQPRTMLLYGPMYEHSGQWQELVLNQFPQRVERQARVVQSTSAAQIDVREAYIDAVLLNVYGGRGQTHVWIDDLAVSCLVGSAPDVALSREGGVRPVAHDAPSGRAMPEVALRNSILSVGGRPTLPRLIEHRGESLTALRQLGFNGIKLSVPPDGALLAEAAEARMWIVCPPPELPPGALIPSRFDPVLAWDLGESLSHRELNATEVAVRRLRDADRELRRPTFCRPATQLASYSELADILVLARRPLSTSLELSDFATWHRQRARLARPGTPVWATVQTQLDESWSAQVSALAPPAPEMVNLPSRQLRQLVFSIVSSGPRGLVFESRTPLDGTDPATRHRAAQLKLLNLELALIESWVAAGTFAIPASSTDRAIVATVLQTDRARLLLPLRTARGDQFAVDEGPSGDVMFIVPGVPESNDAFELSPAGLRPLPHRRVTGGMGVTLRDPSPSAMIVLTQDPVIIDSLTRMAAYERQTAAELSRQLAAEELEIADRADRRLSLGTTGVPNAQQLLGAASERLKQCDAAIRGNDAIQAIAYAREVQRPLGQLRRAHWERVKNLVGSPMAIPFAAAFATQPLCVTLLDHLRTASVGENVLPGGDFEDMDALKRSGWEHFQLPQKQLQSVVELSLEGPHSGRQSLHLVVRTPDDVTAPSLVESPPLWIVSAPIRVEARQLVEIRGWVRVPRPMVGSVDGLLVLDSLGGEALAERVGQTRGWQEFVLYRAAPAAGEMTVTFAITGVGEAYIDDVTIRPITLPQWNAGEQARNWAPTYSPPQWR